MHDGDGFLQGIYHNPAILAFGKVAFQLAAQILRQGAIDEIGEDAK
jgi:hypothetical protein